MVRLLCLFLNSPYPLEIHNEIFVDEIIPGICFKITHWGESGLSEWLNDPRDTVRKHALLSFSLNCNYQMLM